MSKDLRALLQNKQSEKSLLSKNHRANFEEKLQKELHTSKRDTYFNWRIAASFLLVIGIGTSLFYFSKGTYHND